MLIFGIMRISVVIKGVTQVEVVHTQVQTQAHLQCQGQASPHAKLNTEVHQPGTRTQIADSSHRDTCHPSIYYASTTVHPSILANTKQAGDAQIVSGKGDQESLLKLLLFLKNPSEANK